VQVRAIAEDNQEVISLDHDINLVPDPLLQIAQNTAKELGLRQTSVFSYLANNISSDKASIPYSLVTALDEQGFRELGARTASSQSDPPPIILNEWAVNDLGAKPGDRLNLGTTSGKKVIVSRRRLRHFNSRELFRSPVSLLTATGSDLSGNHKLSEPGGLGSAISGRAKARSDRRMKTTGTSMEPPKAFIPLSVGQSLWQTRFGKATSIRFGPTKLALSSRFDSFRDKLRSALNPTLMGLLRDTGWADGVAASKGATDFGEYFLYFSFFLVISASYRQRSSSNSALNNAFAR
jgi:hypothetical protein